MDIKPLAYGRITSGELSDLSNLAVFSKTLLLLKLLSGVFNLISLVALKFSLIQLYYP